MAYENPDVTERNFWQFLQQSHVRKALHIGTRPFSDGELITIGVEKKCYDNLEVEFIYSRNVKFMALEMSPTVSKIQ